jgi:hypothetical protein
MGERFHDWRGHLQDRFDRFRGTHAEEPVPEPAPSPEPEQDTPDL